MTSRVLDYTGRSSLPGSGSMPALSLVMLVF